MSEAMEIEVQGGDWTREALRGTVRPPPGPGVRTGPFEILRKLLRWWTEAEERLGRTPWRPGRAGLTDSEAGPGQSLGERRTELGFGGWDGDPHALLFPPDQPWGGGGSGTLTVLFPHVLGIQGPCFLVPKGLHQGNTPLRCLAVTLGRSVST